MCIVLISSRHFFSNLLANPSCSVLYAGSSSSMHCTMHSTCTCTYSILNCVALLIVIWESQASLSACQAKSIQNTATRISVIFELSSGTLRIVLSTVVEHLRSANSEHSTHSNSNCVRSFACRRSRWRAAAPRRLRCLLHCAGIRCVRALLFLLWINTCLFLRLRLSCAPRHSDAQYVFAATIE